MTFLKVMQPNTQNGEKTVSSWFWNQRTTADPGLLFFLIVIRLKHKLLRFILLDPQFFALRDREKNTWRVWLVVTVRFYFSIFQNFWFLFKFDCRKSKMCKFTTKARLHFFSSYNQIIPPDEMKTERKDSIKKKGERQKKRILNRREKLPTDTKWRGIR